MPRTFCQITVSSDEMARLYTAHIRIDPRQAVLEILDQTIDQRFAALRQFYGPHPLIPGSKAQEAGE